MPVVRRALVLVVALAGLSWAGGASPREGGAEGAALRGEGAALRARIERVRRDLGDGRDVRPDADTLLVELKPRATDPDDPLDADTILAVAGEVAGLRADAAIAPLPMRGSRRDFVRSIAAEATVSDWRWGVPASVTLAQAILESSWGRAAPGFNLFGLKGEGPAGSTQRRVVEYRRGRRSRPTASFRLYDDAGQAIRDHGAILGRSRYYVRARAAGEDVEAFTAALVGVYATDPRYARKILGLIDDLGLRAFDLVGAAGWVEPPPPPR